MKLTKKLMCISMRNGVEIWLENDRVTNLRQSLSRLTSNKFVDLGNEMINTADIVGLFSAKTMEEVVHRRNGRHLCKYGVWHLRGRLCDCRPEPKEFIPPLVDGMAKGAGYEKFSKLKSKLKGGSGEESSC